MYTAGTNFPPHLYDGHLFGKESFYEELAKVQKTEMDKREKVADLYQVQLKMPLFQALEAKKKLGESAKSLSSAQRKSKWDIQGVSNHLYRPNLTIYISSDVACWQWDGLRGNCDISFWKFEQEEVAKQLIWILSLNLVTIKLL